MGICENKDVDIIPTIHKSINDDSVNEKSPNVFEPQKKISVVILINDSYI